MKTRFRFAQWLAGLVLGSILLAAPLKADKDPAKSVSPAIPVIVQNSPSVSVLNSAPLIVRDASANAPFEGTCSGDISFDSAFCTIKVPAGKQLVMQAVSANVSVDSGLRPLGLLVQQRFASLQCITALNGLRRLGNGQALVCLRLSRFHPRHGSLSEG
jgi:hypothetical protein